MILLDKPYISDFLINTLIENNIPVINTPITKKLINNDQLNFVSEEKAINLIKENPETIIYTNSENTIKWIEDHLAFTKLPDYIKIFKDKFAFRELLQNIYPEYYFQKVKFEEFDQFDISKIKFPVIIKPTIGFFSLGVYRIDNESQWIPTISKIKAEFEAKKNMYPKEVVNTSDFVLEEVIDGDEFAIDCYFDKNGKPVIMNILKHNFSSEADMSDRVYFTSKELILEYKDRFQQFMDQLSELIDVKRFAIHVEIRIRENGQIIPIEINPMRFGGWCTTADLAYHAYGLNLYQYFFEQKKPEWNELFRGKDGLIYSMVILDNSTGVDVHDIHNFDYNKLLNQFENPLELRKVDHKKYTIFGIMFCETRNENIKEIDHILHSDLREFI